MGEILEWGLTTKSIQGRLAKLGGIKFHLYNTQPVSGKCLKMCIKQETTATGCGGTTVTSCFFTSLNFKGWGAVWVSATKSSLAVKMHQANTKVTLRKKE